MELLQEDNDDYQEDLHVANNNRIPYHMNNQIMQYMHMDKAE